MLDVSSQAFKPGEKRELNAWRIAWSKRDA